MKVVGLYHIDKAFKETQVLQDFTLEIEEGSFTVIAGPSGSGKSTLLNLIGLLDHCDKGEIDMFDEKDIKPFSAKARTLLKDKIGYLFQNYALVEDKSVAYNLSIALDSVAKKKRGNAQEKMIEALEKVGLPEAYLTKKVYQCSGGEQQRISIARLLLKPCDLILADEPTGSLDEGNKQQVFQLLRKLQEMGKTILMVTHDEELISQSDTVVYLKKQ